MIRKDQYGLLYDVYPDNIWMYPGVDFYDMTGIKVYHDWSYDKKQFREDGSGIVSMPEHVVIESYLDFLDVNPIFEKLETLNIYSVLCGALSKINYDDIEYFVTYTDYRKRPKEIKQRQFDIERYLGVSMSWIPSEKTLNDVESQIELLGIENIRKRVSKLKYQKEHRHRSVVDLKI